MTPVHAYVPMQALLDGPQGPAPGARGRDEGEGSLVKVFGWYDNEWGYSCRLVDLVERPL